MFGQNLDFIGCKEEIGRRRKSHERTPRHWSYIRIPCQGCHSRGPRLIENVSTHMPNTFTSQAHVYIWRRVSTILPQ
ncbi:hypothetical protein KC315_g57 [Hortaea werneckii]|nr:hypothetical protein KC315_g57 [Hortaea werneckii]